MRFSEHGGIPEVWLAEVDFSTRPIIFHGTNTLLNITIHKLQLIIWSMPLGMYNESLWFIHSNGGERGIRTLDTLLTYTRFPSVLLKPLGHLSFSTVSEIIE